MELVFSFHAPQYSNAKKKSGIQSGFIKKQKWSNMKKTALFIELPSEKENSLHENTSNDASLFKSLQKRQSELKKGIGKRFRTKTQKGFLNIHSDPDSEPYCLDNVIGQLPEGEIVTSFDICDDWVYHDGGKFSEQGWSIREFGGFTWLEPLEE